MKKIFALFLILALVFSAAVVTVAAFDDAVYLSTSTGSDDNDASSPQTPKKTWGAFNGDGVISLLRDGGTMVVVGKSYLGGDYQIPKMRGPLTITSVWNGVDYKNPEPKNNPACAFKMAGGSNLTIVGEVTFDNIILFQEAGQNTMVVKDGGCLTITDTVVCMSNKTYFWNIVVEEGGEAVINGGTFSKISGEGKITVADTVTVLDKPKTEGPENGDVTVVFHNSGSTDENDGLTPSTPKKSLGSLTSGLVGMIPRGGTIVTVGKSYIGKDFIFPVTSGPITFTSVWDGVDYKNAEPETNPTCAFKMASGATLTVHSDLIFDDIILFQENAQNTIYMMGGTLIVTDTVLFMTKPGNDYHYKLIVDPGATAILSKAAMENFAIENRGGEIIAAYEQTVVKLQIGNKVGYINDEAQTLDAAPVIKNGSTMLPIRFVATAFGAEVGWDGATSSVTVTTPTTKLELKVGSTVAKLNGEEKTLTAASFIENGRTYLPVRFVAEALGANVEWDGATSTATLTK